MEKQDLIQGRVYRGKHPRKSISGEYDDRIILWLKNDIVQYDSIAVSLGRHYPTTTKDKFLKWAGVILKYYSAYFSKTGQTINFDAIDDNDAFKYIEEHFIEPPNSVKDTTDKDNIRECITQ